MKQTITSLFLAALMSMAGMNALALEQNAQGIFEISSAQDLVDFATLVNDGQNSAGAVLTADIDMASITNFTPIGNAEGRPYIGVFDGQDHALSNLTVNVATYAGLFGYVSGGATVKNLVLDASCVINATEGGYAGIIGGSTGGGNVTMTRLGNEGTVTAAGPNAGGIIGVNMGNAAAFLIENCYATGTVTGVNESGAITGWVGGAGSSIRGCWATATVEGIESGKPFYRGEPTEVKNCYNLTGEQAAKITQEQLESGEFAYNLNGGVTDTPIWFQTLGEDKHPVILSSHKAVYWGGAINCDGKIIPSSGTYTNTVTTHEIPPHEYEDGICKNCGSIDPNASPLQPNADGVYEIGTASNLVAFSKLVNDGNYKINAVLTADIDMSRVANFIPIGLSSENATAYVGTFDGQFHTISHLTIHRDADNVGYVGLFGHVYKGGVVKNLYLKTVNITTDSGTPIATGAVMGRNGAATMINVAAVDVTFNLAAEGDGTTTSHGGLTGALASSTSTRMENCFTNHPSLGYVGGKAKLINSFAGEDVEQMGPTGELCHTLNGDQSAIVWYQTLGEDPYPVLDATHGTVTQMPSAGYCTLFVPGNDVALSAGVEAYAGVITGQVFWLKHALQAVPAATAVVLKGSGYYSITPTAGAQAPAENVLKGTAEPLTADGSQYVLAEKDGTIGFYQAEAGTTIAAGKAYIEYGGAAVKAFNLGDATGINLTPALSQGEGASAIYDLSGRRVETVKKGVFVVNGKKVLR